MKKAGRVANNKSTKFTYLLRALKVNILSAQNKSQGCETGKKNPNYMLLIRDNLKWENLEKLTSKKDRKNI